MGILPEDLSSIRSDLDWESSAWTKAKAKALCSALEAAWERVNELSCRWCRGEGCTMCLYHERAVAVL